MEQQTIFIQEQEYLEEAVWDAMLYKQKAEQTKQKINEFLYDEKW